MSVCSSCGAEVGSDAKFCPECGAKQTPPAPVEKSIQPNFCMNCGAKLKPTDKFCEECGTQVSSMIVKESPKPNLCMNCGHQIAPNQQFCSQCGERTGTMRIAEPLSVSQGIEGLDVIRILLAVTGGLLPLLGLLVMALIAMLTPILSFVVYVLYRGKGLNKLAKVFMYMGIFQIVGALPFYIQLVVPFVIEWNEWAIASMIAFGTILPMLLALMAIIDTPLLIKKPVDLEKTSPISSGIRINCIGGTPLTILGPHAIINDMQRIELDWDKKVFIPLEPNTQHKIVVQFHYFGVDIARYTASFFVQLNPDEIQSYEYKIRSFFSKPYASITRKY